MLFLAGALGIEPSSGVLETLILPMNYTPISVIYYTLKISYSKVKDKKAFDRLVLVS